MTRFNQFDYALIRIDNARFLEGNLIRLGSKQKEYIITYMMISSNKLVKGTLMCFDFEDENLLYRINCSNGAFPDKNSDCYNELLQNKANNKCENCINIATTDNRYLETTYCKINRRNADLCTRNNYFMSYQDLYKLCRYILQVYFNRNTDVIEKTVDCSNHRASRVSVAKKLDDRQKVSYEKEMLSPYITIKRINTDQAINKLHGHHRSPYAHTRRGHWRQYKSGKRIWVEECQVNPKGEKPIYVVEGEKKHE